MFWRKKSVIPKRTFRVFGQEYDYLVSGQAVGVIGEGQVVIYDEGVQVAYFRNVINIVPEMEESDDHPKE